MTQCMKIAIAAVLRFFDEKPAESRGHATAIVAFAGEDLGLGLLSHYWMHQGASVYVVPGPCGPGTKKGKRLDKWVRVSNGGITTYYQVEIKNWSAHAIGGRVLKVHASAEEVAKHKRERWQKEWNGETFVQDTIAKVLLPMECPEPDCSPEPLACFWDAMHPDGEGKPLFNVSVPDSHFSRVSVFSMSAYLRDLLASGVSQIDLEMPETAIRMAWLKRLFP
jgi:hypothetical protein